MKLVLFDCDGTLVDSGALIHEVMARTFEAFGRERLEIARTRSIIGLTLDIAIARLIGNEHVDEEALRMTAHYKSIFADVRREPGFQEPMFEGIADLLSALSAEEDLLLGAVTGKSRRGLEVIMDTHGLRQHFVVSRTADDCPSKPHPAMVTECCDQMGVRPADTIVIGDAIYDMQMAKAAGASAIGVSWGYETVDKLIDAGADRIALKPTDLTTHVFETAYA
ncbi:HAD-IA family hydrolase [Rhizobium sp. PAMB 3182]